MLVDLSGAKMSDGSGREDAWLFLQSVQWPTPVHTKRVEQI